MYTYKVSDSDTQKVKDIQSNQDLSALKTKIDNLNKSFEPYSASAPDQVSFDRLQMPQTSDADLQRSATSSLEGYKNSGINNINQTAYNAQKKLQADVQTLRDQAQIDKQNVATAYASAIQQVSDDALRRGLARSSIVINNVNALTNAQIEEYNKIDKTLSDKLSAINFELTAVEQQKDNALNDFNIAYAVKLDEKLASLRDDLQKQQLEVVKYNNEIAKLENDYNIKYATLQNTLDKEAWDETYDLAKLAAQYGAGMLDKYKANRTYALVKDYLSNFSHDEAVRVLQSSEYLKQVLGSKYSAMMGEI